MNADQQRIAIAEACGYERLPQFEAVWRNAGSKIYTPLNLPNYPVDLNAMHEAEKVLSRGEGYHQEGGFGLYKTALAEVCDEQHPIDATAAQRAEAFLKTIGKWEDGT